MFILCHKCAGLLAVAESAEPVAYSGLLNCQCVSSYVRGFEPIVDREQAIERQIAAQWRWIALFERQGRSERELFTVLEKILRLEALAA